MPQHPLPTIYVDTREMERPHPLDKSKTTGTDMLELVRRHREAPHALPKTLHAGDFMFTGSGPGDEPVLIGIERKRMRDMVNSIRKGRLSGEQIPKLLRYDFPYIIFESRWKTDWVTGQLMEKWGRNWEPVFSGTRQIMNGLEINSFLNDIRDHTPIHILHSEDERQTVELVLALAYSWSKPWSSRHHHLDMHRPQKYAEVEKASTVRRVLCALDGVGWEKSGAAEQVFGTVADLVGASTRELNKIPGFGPKISKWVWEQLHGNGNGGE
jgi:ERCC4-type nuclease